jgi:hypothetical protein
MHPIDATIELYRTINKYESNTSYERIEKLVNYGAHLRKINLGENTPLCHAITNECCPQIIKLLVDRGGADFKFKTLYKTDLIFCMPNDDGIQVDCEYCLYRSLYNTLLIHFHFYMRTNEINTQMYNKFYENDVKKQIKISSNKYPLTQEEKIRFKEKLELLKEYCKILKVSYHKLKYGKLDIPENPLNLEQLPNYKNNKYEWYYSQIKMENYIKMIKKEMGTV